MRFRGRHVHRTVAKYVETELRELGWKTSADSGNVALGALHCHYRSFEPDETTDVQPNTISITLGNEPPTSALEMGDGLKELALPVFVDIYAESQSVALSIAADAKALFEDVLLDVLDYTAGDPGVASGEKLYFDSDEVEISRPPLSAASSDFRRYWRVVKATARVHYT